MEARGGDGTPCCPIAGRGFSAGAPRLAQRCPNGSIQSLLKIAKCVPGVGGDKEEGGW